MTDLPSFITPQNLIEFAGGSLALQKSAAHFRPGSEEWQNRIIADIATDAAPEIGRWLTSQLTSQVLLYQFGHGRRPADAFKLDQDAWDSEFAEALFAFFEPHFELIFPVLETRERAAADWLNEHCADPVVFIADIGTREAIAAAYANTIINAILRMRDTPAKTLSMLGIVPDLTGWPEPAPIVPEPPKKRPPLPRIAPEDGKHVPTLTQAEVEEATQRLKEKEAARKPRGRKKAVAGPNTIHFSGDFLRTLRDCGNLTSKALGEMLGVKATAINNGLQTNSGIIVERSIASGLVAKLNLEAERASLAAAVIMTSLMSAG